MGNGNISMPLSLMKKIMYVLEQLDVSAYDPAIQIEHTSILFWLNKKQRALDLREKYSKMVAAYDEESRDAARIEYLKNRSWHSPAD